VQNLWTHGDFLVDRLTRKFFFREEPPCARTFVRLFACFTPRAAYNPTFPIRTFFRRNTLAVIHHFKQSIAGRPYLIEVSFVAQDRWRAQIVRVPGVPTAMMPFYGPTPDEAAQHLNDWLARAYARAAAPGGTV